MLRIVFVGLTALVLTVGARGQEQQSANAPIAEAGQTSARGSLRGVWKVTELRSRAPGEDWMIATPSTSLFIFTDKHYSYMYTLGAGPRRLFAGDPNRPTDAEKVGAYNSFVAASGTYVLSGATLTLNGALHKNPNEMTGEPLSYTVEIDGNTLRMTIVNPPFAPGRERRTVLARVE